MATGLKRNTIDKFYTKPAIAAQCVAHFIKYIKPQSQDVLIEPSAGGGAFIEPLRQNKHQLYLYDIQPEHSDVIQQDWLQWKPQGQIVKIHIIGNPPFGRQSSLAIQFIKHSALFAETISFILPKSFKKASMKKAFPPNFHLIFEEDLPQNSFLVGEFEHDVPCIFQIWQKKENPRPIEEKVDPKGFEFVKKNPSNGMGPDISFRRVGVNAGTISTDIANKSEQSHYFIRFTNGKSLAENLTSLKQIIFLFDNTVGPRSISKPELCEEFARVI